MTTYTIALASGIGDNALTGMLANVTRKLKGNYRVRELVYPAEYGPVPNILGMNFTASLAILRASILSLLETSPKDSVILVGYSAGAAGIGDVVRELHDTHSVLLDRIAGVYLLADPRQPDYATHNGDDKFGIAGSRGIPDHLFPVVWLSDPADPIPRCLRNSPLRRLADLTSKASISNLIGWATSIIIRLQTQKWQQIVINWHDRDAVRRQFDAAIDAVKRYTGPDHVSYAIREYAHSGHTYTDEIAHQINDLMTSAAA